MDEKPEQTLIFLPAIEPSVKQIWLNMLKLDALFAILAGIHYLIRPEWPHHLLTLLVAFCVSLVVILWRREIMVINISVSDKILSTTYLSAFGAVSQKQINLPTAHNSYKLEIASTVSASWRILIYNNYIMNRLSICAGDGYTKEEMDEIDKLIREIRGK